MKNLSISLGAGLLAACMAFPANAQVADPQIVTSIGVAHKDLDLDSDAGARAMLERLDAAATKACGGKPSAAMGRDQVGQAKHREFRRCKTAALERGTLSLDAPRVRAAWLAKQPAWALRPQPLATGTR